MSAKEETHKNMDFGFCRSFMGNYFKSGSAEGKKEKFNFKSCEQMMKQCCTEKDGKFDFEKFRSKIAEYCKGANKEADNKKSD